MNPLTTKIVEAIIKVDPIASDWIPETDTVQYHLNQELLTAAIDKVLEGEGWISVEDELPKEKQAVIVIQNPKTTATKEPLFSEFINGKFRAIEFSHDGLHLGYAEWSDIIKWQPLPAPPK